MALSSAINRRVTIPEGDLFMIPGTRRIRGVGGVGVADINNPQPTPVAPAPAPTTAPPTAATHAPVPTPAPAPAPPSSAAPAPVPTPVVDEPVVTRPSPYQPRILPEPGEPPPPPTIPKEPAPTPSPAPAPAPAPSPAPSPSPAPAPFPPFTVPPTEPAKNADTGELQAATITPNVRSVDASKETVEGRIRGMLERGNPLLDQAQARAMQAAQARGLLNSSMAAEAGTSALIQSALPIAQADANVYGTAARDNQAAINAALQANQQALNQFAGTRLQSALRVNELQVQAQADMSKLIAQGNIEAGLQQLKNQMEIERNALDNKTKMLLQSNDSVKALFSTTQQNITNIMLNKDLDAAAKDRAVQEQLNLMRTSMALVGSLAGDVDLMGLLDKILPRQSTPSQPQQPSPNQPPPPNIPPPPPYDQGPIGL